ncbi:unnamed protein product, partial [Vitis vinifera]|uniref:Uncharacterized protein n=1 Tax=Vitis vinifera TaxID=29760 RepID=D7SJA0_VITVI
MLILSHMKGFYGQLMCKQLIWTASCHEKRKKRDL